MNVADSTIHIELFADLSCPWCAIALFRLEQAIRYMSSIYSYRVDLKPLALNPPLPPDSQDWAEHLHEKHGWTTEQLAASAEEVRAQAAELDFRYNPPERIADSSSAHRLLLWVESLGRPFLSPVWFADALYRAYFTDGQDISSHQFLAQLAKRAGLDPDQAAQVLASGAFADEVRERERRYRAGGVSAVPTVIVNRRRLVGAQPVKVYEEALQEAVQDLVSRARRP